MKKKHNFMLIVLAGLMGGTTKNEGVVYLPAGKHDVKITKVEYVDTKEVKDDEGKVTKEELEKPFILVTMVDRSEKVYPHRFYLSDKALEMSRSQMLHLFDKVIDEKEVIDNPGKTWKEWAKNMNDKVAGKLVRILIKDQLGNDNKVYTKFGFPPFAENINTKPEASKLLFDPEKDRVVPKSEERTGSTPPSTTGAKGASGSDFAW